MYCMVNFLLSDTGKILIFYCKQLEFAPYIVYDYLNDFSLVRKNLIKILPSRPT